MRHWVETKLANNHNLMTTCLRYVRQWEQGNINLVECEECIAAILPDELVGEWMEHYGVN